MKLFGILVTAALVPAVSVRADALWGSPERQLETLRERGSYDIRKDKWSAAWIEVPDSAPEEYGVYYFRKDIELAGEPDSFIVHVSADQRYKLYVNGSLVSLGPARNDAKHWNYETLDIAACIGPGRNVVAAQVWSEGAYKPVPNATVRPGFILLGEGEAGILNTDSSWKCIRDPGYTPIPQNVPGYYALGAGELVDMNLKIADWLDPDNTLADWKNARPFEIGAPHDDSGGTGVYGGHPLVESALPQVERFEKRMAVVRRDGGLDLPEGWPAQEAVVTVPPGSTVDILLDQEELTNGFFNLNFSGGRAAEITIQYAEALYEDS